MARALALALLALLPHGSVATDVRPYLDEAQWGSTRKYYVPIADEAGYEVTVVQKNNPGVPPMTPSERNRTQGMHRGYERLMLKGDDGYEPRHGLVYAIPNPLEWLKVKAPANGCGGGSFTPQESSKGECQVATNAGFFNTHHPEKACHGTAISDGETINETDELNVSFGMTKDGRIVVGYLTEQEKKQMKFDQLVNGVIWLVRNGKNYITESIGQETLKTQESGCVNAYNCNFRTLKAARLALGHDKDGRVFIVAIDGVKGFTTRDGRRVPETGVDLDQMADIMIQLGATNAMNLDGGGSVGVFENDVQVNSPTDPCTKEGEGYNFPVTQVCARQVTTIMCVRPPRDS